MHQIRITHAITTTLEGSLEALTTVRSPGAIPTLDHVLTTMANLAFVVETVAHLQGKERDLLPSAEEARRIIAALQPRIVEA